MRVSVVRLIATFMLVWGFTPASVSGQTSCQFVLGFADLAAQLGEGIVGTCIEHQRTVTGTVDQFEASGPTSTVKVSPGDAVQRTTTGLMTWGSHQNTVYFFNDADVYALGRGSTPVSTRPAVAPAPASAPPPPEPNAAYGDAASLCFRASTDWMITTLGASAAEKQRAEAEGNAKGYLCEQALTNDGPQGVRCFEQAWEAARGMERVFPGSGRQTYAEKYAACMAGR